MAGEPLTYEGELLRRFFLQVDANPGKARGMMVATPDEAVGYHEAILAGGATIRWGSDPVIHFTTPDRSSIRLVEAEGDVLAQMVGHEYTFIALSPRVVDSRWLDNELQHLQNLLRNPYGFPNILVPDLTGRTPRKSPTLPVGIAEFEVGGEDEDRLIYDPDDAEDRGPLG